jgi:hypothetical protein
MSRLWNSVNEFAIEAFVLVFGWAFCITMLAGAYGIGRWAAPHLGWDGSIDTSGLLSAITFIWLYEHRNVEGKYDRLRELIMERRT